MARLSENGGTFSALAGVARVSLNRLSSRATRKMTQLDAAHTLDFLRSPPGNQFEALRGSRTGQYSIRVNDQFRLCVRWTSAGPDDVEIVDYH